MSKIVLQILKSNEDIPEVKEKNWKVTVIDQEDQNAFVLPNGHIFVFNGMLDMCSNDSQLGIVIGHEIAHALLNHTGEKLTYVNFISALLLIPMAVIWAFVPNDGIGKVFLHIRSLQNKFPTHYLKQSRTFFESWLFYKQDFGFKTNEKRGKNRGDGRQMIVA